MPIETHPTTMRLTTAEQSILDRLGAVWGPTVPLSRNRVMRELIRRAETEVLKTKEKTSRNSANGS